MVSKILYVFAHPDDETFGCGGTIAHFNSLGNVKQILYCATHGEAGKTGHPPVCSPEKLGETRKLELERAIRILGIDELILRDYGDGTLHNQPLDFFVKDLVQVLEQEKPEMVITFPPSGISGHKDHQIIQKATLEAVKQTSFPTKLYYIVIPESIAQFLGRNVYATPDNAVTMKVDVTKYREKIGHALREHRSQNLSVDRVFPGVNNGDFSSIRTHEYYQVVIQK